ncbi:MAG: glycosyltransferase family 4 protein [Synergistaceae bacterium]|nr:glycosyltransferase family 4 protein [Synergistaceae bacterium]
MTKTKKHLLVISQYFHPETFRINDMASEWVRRGYKVTVLTGIPNYPMGKFFPGYSWTKHRREEWNGMDIIRIPLIARGQNSLGMVANYLSFVASGWLWNIFNKVKADLVFSFEVSPMTQVKVGCGYAKKHKVPHFVYVQDLWPNNVISVTGIHNPLIIKPIDRMVDKIYKQADKIFVPSPSFVEAILNREVKVAPEKVHYWPQYAEDFYRPLERQKINSIPEDDNFKIAFTGNIGYAQGLEILPKVASLLKDKKVKFIIVGDGRYQSEFEKQIEALSVKDKFIMIPRKPAEEIPEILSACDAGFISFSGGQLGGEVLWEKTIPAKLQSYMACGKAIIASASGETQRVIREADCGICSRLGDAEELAQGILKLIQSDHVAMGQSARKYFESHFNKKDLMDEMDKFIEEFTNRK